MQHINLIRWLKDVVKGLGGTTPVVRLELVPASRTPGQLTPQKKVKLHEVGARTPSPACTSPVIRAGN